MGEEAWRRATADRTFVLQADKSKRVFYTLRTVQADAKRVGKREAAAKKKEAAAAEANKAKV